MSFVFKFSIIVYINKLNYINKPYITTIRCSFDNTSRI